MALVAAGWARMWKGALAAALTAVLLGPGWEGTAQAAFFKGGKVRALIAARLASGLPDQLGDLGDDGIGTLRTLRDVYAARQFNPLWLDIDGMTPRANTLLSAFESLRNDGLEPERYTGPVAARASAEMSASDIADLDIQLTVGAVQAVLDLASGRLEPALVDPDVFVHQDELDRSEVLHAALKAPDPKEFLLSFRPRQDNYRRLRLALLRYRALQERGGWKAIYGGPLMKLGVRDGRVPYLRYRLAIVGDLPRAEAMPPVSDIFTPTVRDAVMRFQNRHGLVETGEVDNWTLYALNLPVEYRIQQILVNLERRRWMPDEWEDRYIFVNLANFELKVVNAAKTIHVTEVVVGALHHRTRVFSDKIRYLVFNPYWNVPQDIALKEFLPALKKEPDASWLDEGGYDLLSGWDRNAMLVDAAAVDWSNVTESNFAYRLRQRPGEENSLGRVKFMFPNKHNIYMHDTPSKELFNRNSRAFSHGCIRVKDPLKLAAILLQWQEGWGREEIDAVIAAGEQRLVTLDKPIPVHLYYVTAWANKDGAVHFRADVYGRDKLLGQALFGEQNLL